MKRLLFALLAMSMTYHASAFALLGPRDTWQISALGYDPQGDNGDLGGPKNLGEEWRWNLPEITYAFDQSFINFFGTNGMNAVEQAIALYNREMINFSTMTTNQLKAKPQTTRRLHLTAQALGLLDLKSVTMGLLAEQLGLAGAERWTWALRARTVPSPNITNFTVIQRNFDPLTFKPSSYVNGNRFSYQILSLPAAFFAQDYEDAVEFPVDVAFDSTMPGAVSSLVGEDLTGYFLRTGEYFSALTQDDIGGLRYIYSRNNVNTEDVVPGVTYRVVDRTALTFIQGIDAFTFFTNALFTSPSNLVTQFPNLIIRSTNVSTMQVVTPTITITNIVSTGLYTNLSLLTLITNLDLFVFSEASRTNGPAQLRALPNYGALIITETNSYPVTEVSEQYYFTNSPWGVPGDPPAIGTNRVTNIVANYFYRFANVITNYASAITDLEIQDIGRAPWSTPTELVFQTNRTIVRTNMPSGGFYILDRTTNVNLVAYAFSNQFNVPLLRSTNVIPSTNFTIFLTNVFNIKRTDVVNNFTNMVYSAYPIFINGQLGDQIVTLFTTNLVVRYDYTFDTNQLIFDVNGNLLDTNHNLLYFPPANGNTDVRVQTITFLPPNPPVITVTTTNMPFPRGTVLILDTNQFELAGPRIETFGLATNTIVSFTNAATGAFITQQLIYQTNSILFAVYPIVFQASTGPLLRPGVDTLQFRRQRYFDFLSQSNAISTNFYAVTAITNNTRFTQTFRRIAGPDILFSAGDLGTSTGGTPISYTRSVNFQLGGAPAPAQVDGGPGLIAPGADIRFSKVVPAYFNQNPNFTTEETAFVFFAWGSFDAWTVTPIVYPEDITGQIRTLEELEQIALNRNPAR